MCKGIRQHDRPAAAVWLVHPHQITSAALIKKYEAILDDEEQDRYRRFVRPEDAHIYLVSHALVRASLSQYHEIPPEQWQFEQTDTGRPEIRLPLLSTRLRFSLSHTRGLAACLIASEVDVGIDVERLDRASDTMRIAEHFFAEDEKRELRILADEAHRLRFFQLWTLKEAFLKARGTGLSTPLRDCVFHIDRRNQIDPTFRGSVADDPSDWQFSLRRVAGNYVMALAMHWGASSDSTIEQRTIVPLQ